MPSTSTARPRVVDLFAGAGLFSAAFAAEGFALTRAVENDPYAADTYRRNLGDHIEVADIRDAKPQGTCDLLVAGPPCQGFSTLNRMRADDPRNELSFEVVRWARVLKPDFIVIENVAAFLDSSTWQVLRSRLRRAGYEVEATVLNAVDFGVPQRRFRSFTFASTIGFPAISRHPRYNAKTVRAALKGLAAEPDGKNQHYAPVPSPIAKARMEVIPPGGDKRDILRQAPHLAPPSWHRLTCAVTDVWGRMQWDKPCNTLRTALQNASKGRYIHPDQDRVISLREAARLHSIDDGWRFVGQPTHVARQIGNSVPLALGRAVARGIRRLF